MAQPGMLAAVEERAGWKTGVGTAIAVLMGALWVVAGGWKTLNPYTFAALVSQLRVPQHMGVPALPFGALLGPTEVIAGTMLLVPAWRRWGAIITSFLLVCFMGYIGIHYTELSGKDCSCFPWLKRTVSPEFFVGDGLMLAGTMLSGWWAAKSANLKRAAMVAASVAVLSAGSLAYNVSQQTGAAAPSSVTVDGKEYSIALGKVFVFFFDPQCMHCFHSAQEMQKYQWAEGTKIIVAPVRVPEFAEGFLTDTGLKATAITSDHETLRKTFHLETVDPPNGVAIENGYVKASWVAFDDTHPKKELKELGWIQ